jgi:hypothetical protein
MRMSRLVERMCEGDSWKEFLSEARLEKAQALLAERQTRGQGVRLVDCLQFGDKVQIIAKNQAIRSLTRFQSRRQVETISRSLENLRNNLAHAQDIAGDWDMIVMLSSDVEGVIDGTKEVQEAILGRLSERLERESRELPDERTMP